MILNQDFREFIESLNKNDVQYLVVGGYAVAFHGHPRYTKDLDVWIKVEPDNAQRVTQALSDFGFESLGLKPDDFLTPGYVIQLGYPPYHIDILTEVKGVDFDTLFLRKRSAFLFKVDITHANRGHFYSQNDLNSTFPNK